MKYNEFINSIKQENKTILVAYSGGKDSTYILKYLSDLKINVIAYMIDNNYLSQNAINNAIKVCKQLNIRLIIDVIESKKIKEQFKFVLNNDIFSKEQKNRASDICNICMYHINSKIIDFAIKNNIQYISGGYLKGQVPNTGFLTKIPLRLYYMSNEIIEKKLNLPKKLKNDSNEQSFLFSFNPFLEIKIHEKDIINEIKKIGWKKPKDTGLNSSNCLINDFAIKKHIEKYNINPYKIEIEKQLENKTIDKEEANKRLNFKYSLIEDISFE